MRHLEEFGIGGFDPVDGVMREALAAELIDPAETRGRRLTARGSRGESVSADKSR